MRGRDGATPMSAALRILHRDAQLCAVHKPAGLLVHRTAVSRGETRFAVQMLRDTLGVHVHPVHRLDRGTSGVLLFALDRDTARAIGECLAHGQVAKRYLAIVRGVPADEGVIDHPLARVRDAYAFAPEEESASQHALTRYRRLAIVELPVTVDRYPTSRYALVELVPETGRRHQIRRHLKHIAHPVIGDATYGKGRHNRFFAQRFGSTRLLLACVELRLEHPVTRVPLVLQAPPDDDFARVAEALGWEATVLTRPMVPPGAAGHTRGIR